MYYSKFLKLLTAAVVSSFMIIGCGTQSDSKTGSFQVLLHDAPASYDEVNVFIERVEVNNGADEEGWVTVGEPQQVFDLLELTNGVLQPLGEIELETGTYEQVRLILNQDGHSVVVDGVSHNMFIPSGSQTGIKLNVNAEIQPDITYVLLLDFDANRSVVVTGNENSGQNYLLKPVIKATNQAITGNIEGTVSPVEAEPVVYAIASGDTLSSTYADTTSGNFRLIGLEAGTYTVSFAPTNENFQSKDTTGVEVTVDETNDIGSIVLDQN
ncbi:MAG: DUF4382 domain-containing protein [Gracilimonas sp.]|uniref:DUF4382 domain-containing protein n=1 Tax=Gracilimonas sp. TaxID=1974203 RepID=UPI0019CCAE79|nr:DUF4382 domain-containing protein [Gracilimonas sp.]MBD3615637.1 DUF4382 domain-containing protein [Gracilimonas sp.]